MQFGTTILKRMPIVHDRRKELVVRKRMVPDANIVCRNTPRIPNYDRMRIDDRGWLILILNRERRDMANVRDEFGFLCKDLVQPPP